MSVEIFQRTPWYLVSGPGPYPVTHAYRDSEDLVLFVRTKGGGIVSLSNEDFSVEPKESNTGGSVTLSTSKAAEHEGSQLLINRSTKIEQGWSGVYSREKGLEQQISGMVMGLQDAHEFHKYLYAAPVTGKDGLPGNLLQLDGSGRLVDAGVSALSLPGIVDLISAGAGIFTSSVVDLGELDEHPTSIIDLGELEN